ncbi:MULTISPECIES: cellulose biosynthesis cyclic di-GMP-binding regulatory protein BcsB [Leptolyngbya]|uniref:cellulose biosynthesis cyclic di-GMP-binding regulatory protein BcsB n=1 Tax=Leptolyngbya TaxID=47251 RepID=UPI001686225A|nr:cellulose biosynthesis cyclic di-GMP-binding regulatory protein BcsB [Leptolyngbya sp. FACHB-1624]MBD1855915.1 cellulose biosynthesis cyclic di-GMP-binding regulatory protein BcsB [Leptolyngbya sp. FACHB-1624]
MNKRSNGQTRRSALRDKTWLSQLIFFGSLGCVTALAIALTQKPVPQVSAQAPQAPTSSQLFKLPTATSISQYRPLVSESDRLIAQATPDTQRTEPQPAELNSPNPTEKPPEAKGRNPISRYIVQFNRSPIIGNRFRLEGLYAESQFGFTRPRQWEVKSAKAKIRYQHSPALIPDKSNLVVRVNDTSIGSVPLNLKNAQAGVAEFNIPLNLLQDENQISIVAQQVNSSTCSNPDDQTLWSEVLSDSEIVFDYTVKPIDLDFSRYPFPFFDQYGLDSNRMSYLMPTQMSESWLTALSRFHTHYGRVAEFRPLETLLINDLKKFQWNDRIVILGTPDEQPALKTMKLPYKMANNRFVDGNNVPLPDTVGVVMLATLNNGELPALVVSGNGTEGVTKAAQFLIQPVNRQIGAGNAILVNDLADAPSPAPRAWSHYLPDKDSFQLAELTGLDNKPFKDKTVKGTSAAPVQVHFRALPDDRFMRGSTMNLKYSYSAQVNPRLSNVSVRIDGVGIGSRKLDSDRGGQNETLTVDLPANLIKPNSIIDVDFDLYPQDASQCGYSNDQQLWGTVHSTSSFNLRREHSVELPDLKLLTTGFPLAAPQDLSNTAIVVPDAPTTTDLMTLLKFSERMGRLTNAQSVKMDVFKAGSLPEGIRKDRNIVAIGTRDRFPVQQAFETGSFQLMDVFGRGLGQDRIQTLPDASGVIKSVMSPWNPERVLIALSGQTENGLKQIQDILSKDNWFYQLKNDTVLINANPQSTSSFDNNAYQLQFLDQAERRRIENVSPLSKARRFLEDQWFFLPLGIITAALILYGVAQLFLKRVAR